MAVNKSSVSKTNTKGISTKVPSKTINKKPVNKKSSSKEKSISLYIWLIIVLIIIVGGLFYIFSRQTSTNTSKIKNKTHYVTANKEPEKLDVKTYVIKENKKQTKFPENVEKKPLRNENQLTKNNKVIVSPNNSNFSKNNKVIVPQNNSNFANNNKLGNEPISNDKEWQPINPGMRAATNSCNNLIYGGKPVTNHKLNILENMSYYSAYSELKRNPLWVAYRLDAYKGQNQLKRLTKFSTDFRTKAKINQKIYLKSGYDKGHLCPNSAIAARYGREGQKETFLMSNISPQTPELNRKVWERLERLEEAYANKFGGIWVITGPIFDQHIELLGRQVEIPDAFYKILIDEDKGRLRVLPFIFPQRVTGKEILNDYLTTVDEIERRTGLDFFTPMDDEFERKLESYLPKKTMWK